MRCRTYGLLLSVLAGLFLARVAGQALVAFLGTPWLPPRCYLEREPA